MTDKQIYKYTASSNIGNRAWLNRHPEIARERTNYGRLFIGRVGKMYYNPYFVKWGLVHLYRYYNHYITSACQRLHYKLTSTRSNALFHKYSLADYLKQITIEEMMALPEKRICKRCFNTNDKLKKIKRIIEWNEEYAEQRYTDHLRAIIDKSGR